MRTLIVDLLNTRGSRTRLGAAHSTSPHRQFPWGGTTHRRAVLTCTVLSVRIPSVRDMSRWSAQMSFDELGRPLRDVTFCVVDLETTGGSAAAGSMITEIGAVKVRGGEVLGEFQTLVNPHQAIPPF